jgi:cation transport ATPase
MAARQKTVFAIPKMDCAAEERLIRMALAGQDAVQSVHADLATRRLRVVHEEPPGAVDAVLQSLNLGSRLIDTVDASEIDLAAGPTQQEEARTLTIVLVINAGMFVGEAIGAFLADSSALLADSLDMFAGAAVYGLALFGVHRARAARAACT